MSGRLGPTAEAANRQEGRRRPRSATTRRPWWAHSHRPTGSERERNR